MVELSYIYDGVFDKMSTMNLPLEDYLKELYPDASDNEIQQYLTWIEEDESDRLPPTKAIKEYLELKKISEEAEARMDTLKKEIINQRQRLNHKFQLLDVRYSERRSIKDSELYKWVQETFSPELVEQMTVKILDYNMFKKLEAQGKLEYDELPESCYTETPTWTLAEIKPKKSKK